MRLAGIAFTMRGAELLKRLLEGFQREGEETEGAVASSFAGRLEKEKDKDRKKGISGDFSVLQEPLKCWVQRQFQQADGIFFVGAAGIAVRACAPFIKSKTEDPAVVVLDETGNYAISLLSGHLGGANHLARRAAELVGAEAVITTATDRNDLFAPDMFAERNGLEIEDMQLAKEAAAAIIQGEQVGFFCDFPLDGELPRELSNGEKKKLNLWVTDGRQGAFPWTDGDGRCLRLLARDAVLGIGCRKGTGRETIEDLAGEVLEMAGMDMSDVFLVASIDLKQEEQGLLDFALAHKKMISFYSAEELEQADGVFSESPFVRRTTGVGTVCERAAVLAAGRNSEGLLVRKQAKNGVTAALAKRERRIQMVWQ